MGTVFYLPGILGSELDYQLPPGGNYWADEKTLWGNLLSDLRLDGTVSIIPAAGAAALIAGDPLNSHYGRAINQMKADLKGTNFEKVIPYGYDWRYSIVYSAGFLASAIQKEATPTNPCVLVGHSMGGLVARMAYYQLRTASKGNLVKRIICIGTPHRGSARVIKLLDGDFDEGIGWAIRAFLTAFTSVGVNVFRRIKTDLISYAATWPGLLEMLPMLENDGTEAESVRKAAFKATAYSGGGKYWQALFDNAKDAVHPLLRDGVSIPPGKKLVCIVGTGYNTPYVTGPAVNVDPALKFLFPQPLFVASDGDGDGTVTETSAYVPGSEKITVECSHSALPKFLASGNLLNQLILDNFDEGDVTPPPPAKPPQDVVAPFVGWPLEPKPPAEPPPPPVRSLTTGRGRPVRR